MKAVLESLYQGKHLTQTQMKDVMTDIVSGNVDDITLSSLLTALKIKGEVPEEIAGAAAALIDNATPFDTPDYPFVDIVGTGGDGHNTINISSASAIVAAACGLKVAKHGNKSVSSKSGSADLFASFGLNLTMSPATAKQCLDQTGLCFLFAPNYHAGIKHAMPVRTTLKTRTLFNLLGPLVNPARPSHIMIGVYSPQLVSPFAETLKLLGYKNAMVVHGSGLDELALHGSSTIAHLCNDVITTTTVTAADFGLAEASLEAIKGDTPDINRQLIEAVLKGQGKTAHEDAVVLNTAPLLVLTGKENTYQQAAETVRDVIQSGRAIDLIQACADISQGVTLA